MGFKVARVYDMKGVDFGEKYLEGLDVDYGLAMCKTEDDLIKAYTTEIYSMYYNSIRYKVILLDLSTFSILAGSLIMLFMLLR